MHRPTPTTMRAQLIEIPSVAVKTSGRTKEEESGLGDWPHHKRVLRIVELIPALPVDSDKDSDLVALRKPVPPMPFIHLDAATQTEVAEECVPRSQVEAAIQQLQEAFMEQARVAADKLQAENVSLRKKVAEKTAPCGDSQDWPRSGSPSCPQPSVPTKKEPTTTVGYAELIPALPVDSDADSDPVALRKPMPTLLGDYLFKVVLSCDSGVGKSFPLSWFTKDEINLE